MTTRAVEVVIREKALLRARKSNVTGTWVYVGGLGVSVSISGTFQAKVTVRTDNAGYEGPVSNGTILGVLDVPTDALATIATTYPVNWVRVDVENYVVIGGETGVNADMVAR